VSFLGLDEDNESETRHKGLDVLGEVERRVFGTTSRITVSITRCLGSIAMANLASNNSMIEDSAGEPLPWRLKTRCFFGVCLSGTVSSLFSERFTSCVSGSPAPKWVAQHNSLWPANEGAQATSHSAVAAPRHVPRTCSSVPGHPSPHQTIDLLMMTNSIHDYRTMVARIQENPAESITYFTVTL
jgi:hypothetical protein